MRIRKYDERGPESGRRNALRDEDGHWIWPVGAIP